MSSATSHSSQRRLISCLCEKVGAIYESPLQLFLVQLIRQLLDALLEQFDFTNEFITLANLLRRIIAGIAIGLRERMQIRRKEPRLFCFEPREIFFRLFQFLGNFRIWSWHIFHPRKDYTLIIPFYQSAFVFV